jgi:hypothetical protein
MTTFQATLLEDLTEPFGGIRIPVVDTHYASTPIEADLIQSAPAGPTGVSPEVASVVSVSSTQIRVNFVKPALDNAALRSVGSYQITPALTIYSVSPEPVAEPTYVVLTISEQKTFQVYDLELIRIEAAP